MTDKEMEMHREMQKINALLRQRGRWLEREEEAAAARANAAKSRKKSGGMRARHRLAARQLALGNSPAEVAQHLKMHRDTLYRWQKKPEFMAEMQRLAGEHDKLLQIGLRRLVDEAVQASCRAMQGQVEGESGINVALSVLKMAGIERVLPHLLPEDAQMGANPPPLTLSPPG